MNDFVKGILRAIILGVLICALLSFLLSCKSKEYVPVEVVKTEIVHKRDTVKEIDTIRNEKETIIREARPDDSVMLSKMGIKLKENERLLILMRSELTEKMRELSESHDRDSVRVDSVQVPVPVERKLTRYESTCIEYGKLMMGGTAVAVIIGIIWLVRWIRRIRYKI